MSQAPHTSYFVHQLLRARNWQHRPQFDEVCKWWREGGRGVLALVGMGGAGKTAIAERFLRVLPGGLPEVPDSKDATLRRPKSVFVFSFYDAPNPEAFFEALQMWLDDSAEFEKSLSLLQLFFKLQRKSGLLVLDGLEKVQEDGVRGLLGRLASPKLREFLDYIAAGYVQDLGVLVTSRFPLADLRDARPKFFLLLPIDEIELPAGIQLLRARGVRGTEPKLVGIVDACGRHALTVDFAGGFITEFGDGDPATPVDFKMDSAELRQKLDDEPDEARRHVLKQGHRFARLAERYRDAMLGNTSTGSEGDAAALALLQRICLFRLGVNVETLVKIFTGEKAARISGTALAGLNVVQLQRKLDWLIKMHVVEATTASSLRNAEGLEPKALYTIHPAVRDGFFSGIGDVVLRDNHEAVRRGLEVSLGTVPGENPSAPETLDLLEEIVHHTLQSGHVSEAWSIYRYRVGGFGNLGRRLGQSERGMRICRLFVDDELMLNIVERSYLHNNLGLFARELGSLSVAIEHFDMSVRLRRQTGHSVALGLRNVSICLRLMGWISKSHDTGEDALAESIAGDDRVLSTAILGYLKLLAGDMSETLSLLNSHSVENAPRDGAGNIMLYPSTYKAEFLQRIGRTHAAKELLGSIHEKAKQLRYELDENRTLLLVALAASELRLAEDSVERRCLTNDWAETREAKHVICWSAFVKARIAIWETLQLDANTDGCDIDDLAENFLSCSNALRDGLKIARDCGFGLLHVDLLLLRARLYLLSGAPQAALDDLRTALDEGVPANERTGQPELLAATHPECGYAWAIAEGLQLRGEALLLQAAQELQSATIIDRTMIEAAETNLKTLWQVEQELANAAKCRESHKYAYDTIESMVSGRRDIALTALRQIPTEIARLVDVTFQKMTVLLSGELNGHNVVHRHHEYRAKIGELQTSIDSVHDWRSLITTSRVAIVEKLITQARNDLESALACWQPLHDPEPELPDQNFQLDGTPYNYRAAETYRILTDLKSGVLTRYPFCPPSTTNPTAPNPESKLTMSFHVFLSHNSKDKPAVKELGLELRHRGLNPWLDEWELRPGLVWQDALEDIIKTCQSAAICVTENGIGPWEDPEMKALLRRFIKEKNSANILPIIPVLLPGAPASVQLPLFLEEFTWVDLRNGLTKDGLDKLVWGITGMKPMESPVTPPREGIFISNQTMDNSLRDELRKVLEADPELRPRVWDFSKVKPSENFEEIIKDRVKRTKVMIVLASPEYLAPTCWAWDQEFLPAIEALKRGELKIIWLVSRPVNHSKTPLKNILSALPLEEPVAAMSPEKRAAAWLEVRGHVKDALGIASKVESNESQFPKSQAHIPQVQTPRITSPQSRHDLPEPKNSRYLTWLHLSDLHFCEDRTGWDAHRVLRPLEEDLKSMEADYGLCPEFLFFTGDAAFGNIGNVPGSTLKEQFDGAEKVLEGARNAFSAPIPKMNVFIVPGNHDVDRNEITEDQTEWLSNRRDPSEVVNLIKKAGKQWQKYLERLDAYKTFLTRFNYQHLLSDPQRLIYSQVRKVHGLRLGIAGFNSAWSCGEHDKKGGLWFGGDWQTGELMRQLADVDFRVALIHHPFGWFVEPEDSRLRISIERDFGFCLHGHEHLGWVDPKADGHVRIAAAACYQSSEMDNGYNIVRINLDTGEGEVWLRQYDAHGGGWVPRVVKKRTDNNGMWRLRHASWVKGPNANTSPPNPQ